MIDNKEKIAVLLDLFMEGKTSVEEENQLAEYFRSEENVPAEWEDYKTMFAYFDNGMEETQQQVLPEKAKVGFRMWRKIAVAASVLLFVGGAIIWYFSQKNVENMEQTTIAKISKTEKIGAKTSTCRGVIYHVPVDKTEEIGVKTSDKGSEKVPIVQKASGGEKEFLVQTVGKKSTKVAKNNPVRVELKFTSERVADEMNMEISDEERIKIVRNIENINKEIAQAQTNVYVASQQAQGIRVIYDEDGTIYQRNCSSKSKNIIEL